LTINPRANPKIENCSALSHVVLNSLICLLIFSGANINNNKTHKMQQNKRVMGNNLPHSRFDSENITIEAAISPV